MNRKAAAYTLLVWTAIGGVIYGLTFFTIDQIAETTGWLFGGLFLFCLILATYDSFAKRVR